MMPQKKAGANGYRNVETMSTPNPFVAVQVNLVLDMKSFSSTNDRDLTCPCRPRWRG